MRILPSLMASVLVMAAGAAEREPVAGGTHACGLLSQLEMRQSGLLTGEPRGSNPGGASRCMFAVPNGGGVEVLLRANPDPAWISGQIARMERGVRMGTYHDEPGIGARSFLRAGTDGQHYVCVFGVDYYLQISLHRVEKRVSGSAVLTELARAAVRNAGRRRCR